MRVTSYFEGCCGPWAGGGGGASEAMGFAAGPAAAGISAGSGRRSPSISTWAAVRISTVAVWSVWTPASVAVESTTACEVAGGEFASDGITDCAMTTPGATSTAKHSTRFRGIQRFEGSGRFIGSTRTYTRNSDYVSQVVGCKLKLATSAKYAIRFGDESNIPKTDPLNC